MRFTNLFISLVGLSASVAGFTINNPSASTYWVQFATNTISWSNAPNDPSTVTLQIINANSTLLNGIFTIAEYVHASLESYTVTNVTLVVADGYMVQMVNPMNSSQVYATSSAFSVKPNGTAPAPGSAPGSSNAMAGNMTGMNMNGMNMNGMNMTGMNTTNGTNLHSSGFNSITNGTSSKNGATSSASSLLPISFAALTVVASAVGLVIV